MLRYLTLFLFSALLSFSTLAAPNPAALFNTINLRLSYMEDVGLYKANHHLPIEDVAREKVVIDKAIQSAQQAGLDGHSVAAFFKSQITAAKAIQYRYRADLLNQPTQRTPQNLKTVIRPALIQLGKAINTRLKQYLSAGGKLTAQDWPKFQTTIACRYLSTADKKALFDALTNVRLK
jgi:chorismate mutase